MATEKKIGIVAPATTNDGTCYVYFDVDRHDVARWRNLAAAVSTNNCLSIEYMGAGHMLSDLPRGKYWAELAKGGGVMFIPAGRCRPLRARPATSVRMIVDNSGYVSACWYARHSENESSCSAWRIEDAAKEIGV